MKKALLYAIIAAISLISASNPFSFVKSTYIKQKTYQISNHNSPSVQNSAVYSENTEKSCIEKETAWNTLSETTAQPSSSVNITSKSAFLMDQATKIPLFSHNEEEKLPIASMCKIMTLVLAFQEVKNGNLSMDERILVSQNASNMGGSQVYLRANEEYLVSDLIKSIVISSANDSCVAIAEKISGTTDCFVEEMNKKAAELGMKNTVFTNCTGLPKPGQFSTAKDVAIMLSELLNSEQYYQFSTIWMDKIYHKDGTFTELTNTNKLIRAVEGCDGGKTGFTQEAKFCLAATVSRENLRLISVIIGANDSKTRFKESADLLRYGFANYKNEVVVSTDPLDGIFCAVKGGKGNRVSIRPQKEISVLKKRGESQDVRTEISLQKTIKAPVMQGQAVGKITLYKSGVAIEEVPLITCESVAKKNFWDAMREISKNFSILARFKNATPH